MIRLVLPIFFLLLGGVHTGLGLITYKTGEIATFLGPEGTFFFFTEVVSAGAAQFAVGGIFFGLAIVFAIVTD